MQSTHRMRARTLKRLGRYNPRPQLTIFDEDTGGYETLTPTKGWKRVSGARIRAQQAMLNKFGFIR